MTDEMFLSMRKLSREQFHSIWEIAKTGELDVLPKADRRVAKIMLEHQDEYFTQFEMADLTHEHDFDPDSEENPFLHIALHQVVENQMEDRDPIEVFQFYNSLRKKKVSRHEIIHLIAMMLAPLVFSVIQQKREFDLETYVSLLRKYKGRKPEKIWARLDKEPDPLIEG